MADFLRLFRMAVRPGHVEVVLPHGLWSATMTVVKVLSRFVWLPATATATAWAAAYAADARVIALLCSAVALFLASVVVHEIGHVAAYRLISPTAAASFSATNGRFRLTREPLPAVRDITVTVAGPASALLLPLVLLPGFASWPLQVWTATAIGLGHLTLLFRSVGDGAALRQALRSPTPQDRGTP
ncbi:hypothetical protein [Arthrobacter sp. M4]|uniref:hypothetical protein n=1 Tax=Arthrobacter sp. M4 TaxID=218160 RepID=UPI001CDBA53D|nr:hypothetical protein [Arthrobacter sp. M4]MCA4134120.1 hypothetical protein [Arthrobacter sp. M4]